MEEQRARQEAEAPPATPAAAADGGAAVEMPAVGGGTEPVYIFDLLTLGVPGFLMKMK